MWRDVWISVSSKYYNLLHSLEEDDLLDISCTDDIFCVHYGFLPRLKRDLEIFTEAWNHHPLRTEGNRSPTQIWDLAQMLDNTNVNPENLAVSVLYTVLVFPGTKCQSTRSECMFCKQRSKSLYRKSKYYHKCSCE